MYGFSAFKQNLRKNSRLILLLFIAILLGVFTFSSDKFVSKFAEVKINLKTFAQYNINEDQINSLLNDPKLIKQAIIKSLNKGLDLELINTDNFQNHLDTFQKGDFYYLRLNTYDQTISNELLNNYIADLMLLLFSRVENFRSDLKKQTDAKINKLENLINNWEQEAKQIEFSAVRKDLVVVLSEFKQKSKVLTYKHPEMQRLYQEFSALYGKIDSNVPDIENLSKFDLDPSSHAYSSENRLEVLQSQLSELSKSKLALEAKSIDDLSLNSEFYSDPVLKDNSYLKFLVLFIFFPALLATAAIIMLWYALLVLFNKTKTSDELAASIEVEKVYSFPRLNQRSKRNPKNLFNNQPLLIDYETSPQQELFPSVYPNNLSLSPLDDSEPSETEETIKIQKLVGELIHNVQVNNYNSFIFSAPTETSGHSDVIANLAVAFSKLSKKVLLIDANFYRPDLHAYFNISPSVHGFSDYLVERIALKTCLQITWQPGLNIMTAGTQVVAGRKLISSEKIITKLKALSKKFDFVLINTGSMDKDVAINFIAKEIGGMYLVVDSQTNTLAVIKEALLNLSKFNIKTEAVILNNSL